MVPRRPRIVPVVVGPAWSAFELLTRPSASYAVDEVVFSPGDLARRTGIAWCSAPNVCGGLAQHFGTAYCQIARASFGRQHTFVISCPVTVENRPRFQSGGFWFEIIAPWPTDWAYTDDCYVDYIDGEYFLFDVLHPGVRVAVCSGIGMFVIGTNVGDDL